MCFLNSRTPCLINGVGSFHGHCSISIYTTHCSISIHTDASTYIHDCGLIEILSSLCRYFNVYAKSYHRVLLYLWTVLWMWVDPIIMLVIFFAALFREIIDPLRFTVYRNVSLSHTYTATIIVSELIEQINFAIVSTRIWNERDCLL